MFNGMKDGIANKFYRNIMIKILHILQENTEGTKKKKYIVYFDSIINGRIQAHTEHEWTWIFADSIEEAKSKFYQEVNGDVCVITSIEEAE